MKTISEYSPYVYLNKTTEDTYFLGIAILHYQGQSVELVGEVPYYADGTTMLQFKVKGHAYQGNNPNLMMYPYYIVLNPYEKYGKDFDLQSFQIEVEVKNRTSRLNGNGGSKSKKIKILYQDADEAPFTLENDFALHSPYLYLNNPLRELGGSPEKFRPYCLIFGKGYQALSKPFHPNGDGVYEQTIELFEDSSQEEEVIMIDPQSINSNGSIYADYDEITGYFETVVYQNRSANNGRKGKLRNVSADGDSNPFQI